MNFTLAAILSLMVTLSFTAADRLDKAMIPAATAATGAARQAAGIGSVPIRIEPFTNDGDPEATERGMAAVAQIAYPWQEKLPDWQIRFLTSDDGAYGYTMTREKRIDIYVRDEQSEELLVHVVAHELGHAVDVALNDGDDRQRWRKARAIEDAPWWPDNRAADFATGAGDFAESFAVWQVGSGSYRSELGPPPGSEQLRLIAELAAG